MANSKSGLITVKCPCCEAELKIDPETEAVIRYTEHVKPAQFGDLETAYTRFQGEAGRREEAFQKSVQEQKQHQHVLDRKFDELLKQVKENPDEAPPLRDIDID